MRYAIIMDENGNMIGTAERSGDGWRGQIRGVRIETLCSNLLLIARAMDRTAHKVWMLPEPIWQCGTVIA